MYEQLIDGGAVVTEIYGPGQAFQPCPDSFNPGLDLAAPCGATTRAVGYGTVLSVGQPCWAGPHAVIVRSGNVDILYAHQGGHHVSPGQQVGPGDAIGSIGSMTGGPCCGVFGADPCAPSSNCGGVSTGPHMHWQVNPAGVDFSSGYCRGIDPTPYLSSWPGAGPAVSPPPPPSSPLPPPPSDVGLQGVGIGGLVALAGAVAGAWIAHSSYRKMKAEGASFRL